MKPSYPPTRSEDIVDTLHGIRVPDPYRWLEDGNSDEVKRWMAAQDQLARDAIAKLPGRDRLLERYKQLYYLDSITPPVRRGRRYFYARTHADREKAIVYWREGEVGEERVLIDPNQLSPDGAIALGVWVPSWDGARVAYALRANASDEAVLQVMDVATGKISAVDVIEGAKYASPSWTPTGDGFYYTWVPPVSAEVSIAERPGCAEVRFHQLGSDPKNDAVAHGKTGDPRTFIGADLSRDGRWLLLWIMHGWNAHDVYYRDLHHPGDGGWRPLRVGQAAKYDITVWQNRLYILTNEGAPRFRLLAVDAQAPAREHWREIVPEHERAVLDGVAVRGGHLALRYLKNAASHLELRTLDGAPVRELALPGIGDATALVGNPEDDDAYYGYTSFTEPFVIFKTSIANGGDKEWARVKVPFDPAPYSAEQVWYASKDGTPISMFLVHRKQLPLDGTTPFLLYGYGGFSVAMGPQFMSSILPWLEAGGGFAMPNLRGGGEYGEEWHQAGMGARKQNVFDDFIAAARYLIDRGYTRAGKLAISGGSNGGLLVGAAMTQQPELFRAVKCAVPLLDMIRYHLFGSGKTWIGEYGSAENEAELKTLLAYSPYHHVEPGRGYPALLMLSADADDRVDPLHARKMTAALQAASASGRPVLLRIEQHAGHGGADLIKQEVAYSADGYAFLMHELGMTPAIYK